MKFKSLIVVISILGVSFLSRAYGDVVLPESGVIFTDVAGNKHNTRNIFEKPTLVFFQGDGCPISSRQLTKIEQFENKYSDRFNVLRIELNSNKFENQPKQNDHVIYAFDNYKVLARYLNPQTMTESFLIANNKILYRGALDNQFGLLGTLEKNIKSYLENAVQQYLDAKEIQQPQTSPVGCVVDYANKKFKMKYSDFSKVILPIVKNRCLQCHYEGDSLNFSDFHTLATFKDMIGYVVKNDIMPPWAAEGDKWNHDLRLTRKEKTAIAHWVESDDVDFSQIKKNKLFENLKSKVNRPGYTKVEIPLVAPRVKTTQKNEFRYFKFTLKNREPIWIDFIQIQSKLGLLLHHAVVVVRNSYIEDPAEVFINTQSRQIVGSKKLESDYLVENNKEGFYIPANAWFYVQAHYEKLDNDVQEELSATIYKFKKVPSQGIYNVILNIPFTQIKIPPNTKDYHLNWTEKVPLNEKSTILAVMAHMHSRGSKVLLVLNRKGLNQKIEILRIEKFSSMHQRGYFLKNEIKVASDDSFDFDVWYDNTKGNPNNPDPTVFVEGGLNTENEMGVGIVWLKARSGAVEKLLKSLVYK